MPLLPSRESFKGQLGRNLGEALTALANSKLQGINLKNTASNLVDMGFKPQEAVLYAKNPDLLQQALKFKQEERYNQGLYNLLSGNQNQPSQENKPNLETTQKPGPISPITSQPSGGMSNLLNIGTQNTTPNTSTSETPLVRPQDALKLLGIQQGEKKQNLAERKFEREETNRVEDKAEKRSNRVEDKKVEREKYEDSLNESSRKYLEPYERQVDNADKDILDYQLLQDLVEKGDVQSGTFWSTLNRAGLGEFFRNYDTELAQKLVSRLSLNSSTAYGPTSRITNYLEQNFIKSIPSLWNNPEALIGIAQLNSNALKALKIKHDERLRLIQQNGGKIPSTIESQVRKNTEDQVKHLENESFNLAKKTISLASKKNNKNKIQIPNTFMGNTIVNDNGMYLTWDPARKQYSPSKPK